MPAKISLIGRVYGRLKVIADSKPRRNPKGMSERWSICVCICGTEIAVRNHGLTSGNTKSCGCLNLESAKSRHTTHGHTVGRKTTGTYHSWACMLTRCTNPNRDSYKYYVAKGITVCERWKVFENFLMDMGERPKGTSLGRIKNELGYFRENCRWETPLQQGQNTARNRVVSYNGSTACMAQMCRNLNVCYGTVMKYLRKGMSTDEALRKAILVRKH